MLKSFSIKLLAAVLVSFGLAATAAAQTSGDRNGKVVVKTDEFTGKKTVSIKKAVITPELSVDFESTIKTNETNPFEKEMEYATLTFINSGNTPLRAANLEVNFMVDGQIVKGGPATVRIKPQMEQIIAVADISNLEKIGKGKTVKMKIGEQLFELDKNTISLIKEFARAVRY